MTPRAYTVVDVFTARPLLGNPVAVVLDAAGLDSAQMQAIARWTNLSETTFVLPASVDGADYRLRIFTPRSELPFAGHPTLGSAHAVLEAGIVTPRDGVMVQECGQGLVPIRVTGTGADRRLSLRMPAATLTRLTDGDITALEGALGARLAPGIAPARVDVGAVWIVAALHSAADVLALTPDFARCARLERHLHATGISVFGDDGAGGIEVRSFAPSCGVDEDPVCGSGNGSIAAFRAARGLLPAPGADYTARQGRAVGRDGHVAVRVEADGAVHIGGACVTCVQGSLTV
ncbi:PhzF family phenazine biosynthesis isomerase [Novosphingobium sp. FSY-8]|uniref:PhzF family phenazine biosynthesis isomerase n=2 Tax=Novosphingobium ovatum TaxID=1908523 RepID=A0ABW9XDV3_9SPHN|nr:PhzF family phenazine biosynthesis isomerase [Novosphingobium ovatum]